MTDPRLLWTPEHRARLARLAARAREDGLDAVVVGPGADMRFLLGRSQGSHERFTGLVVPADGEPEDVADEREAAMSAALQVQLGETTLEEVSQNLVIARAEVARAMAAVKGAVIAAAAGGASETELAARTGLNRSTVRAALGK